MRTGPVGPHTNVFQFPSQPTQPTARAVEMPPLPTESMSSGGPVATLQAWRLEQMVRTAPVALTPTAPRLPQQEDSDAQCQPKRLLSRLAAGMAIVCGLGAMATCILPIIGGPILAIVPVACLAGFLMFALCSGRTVFNCQSATADEYIGP